MILFWASHYDLPGTYFIEQLEIHVSMSTVFMLQIVLFIAFRSKKSCLRRSDTILRKGSSCKSYFSVMTASFISCDN